MKQGKQWARRIFSVLLTLTMAFVSFPAAFSFDAAAASATSGTTGDCTWKLNGTVLTISGNGAMGFYSSNSPSPWGKDITEIIITDGVTNIGSSAFSSCTSLISITIPNSVMHIGSYAFYGCTGLTDIAIPDSVTKIGYLAFFRCSNLESITVAQRNSVYHSDGNCLIKTANKELIVGCKNSVIPCDGTVTSIGADAFYKCTGLTEISIPDGVTSIDSCAFKYCTNLKVVSISNDVTSIDYDAFSDCTGLTNITLSGSVTSIGSGVFRGCTALTNITIPDSVTSIGESAFSGCTALTSITIPDCVTNITASAFFETGYYYDERNWEDGVLYIGNHLIKAKNNVSGSYTIKPSVKTISSYAFRGCTGLTNITIPDSVTSIGDSAFSDCTNLCIRTPENSAAHRYAIENSIQYVLTERAEAAARPVIGSSRMTENKRLEVTLRTVDGYEYRCDAGAWQSSPVFGDLYLGGEHRFYQRLAGTEDHAAGVESEALCFTFIESITAVSTKELIENYSGYLSTNPDGSEYFQYWPQITYTVTYDGGKTFTGTDSELYEKFGESVSGTYQSYENQWHVGENTYRFSFMGVKGECTVTVVKSPIESITAVGVRDLMQDIDSTTDQDGHTSYSIWPEVFFEYTVTYDGGKVFKGNSDEVTAKFGGYVEMVSQLVDCPLGENTIAIRFMGVNGTATVNVVVCAYKSIEISGKNDLTITFTKIDGSKVVTKVIGFINRGGGLTGTGGVLQTTIGTFYSAIFSWKFVVDGENGVAYRNEELQLTLGKLTSNKINCNYAKAVMDCYDLYFALVQYYTGFTDLERNFRFNSSGYSSIEALISIACLVDGSAWSAVDEDSQNTNYPFAVLDVKAVEASVREVFGITVDATASSFYNTETGKIKMPLPLSGGVLPPSREFTFSDGVWTYTNTIGETLVTIKLNEDLTVKSVSMYDPSAVKAGDLDGDEKITDADAVYLLMHTFFPDEYPVDQGCDFDGDGKVTDADAVYLLMYTFFPDEYPIQ